MADTQTTIYHWIKPEDGSSDDTWGTKLNANLDSQDTIVSGLATNIATLSSSVAPGGPVNKFRNATLDVWQRGTTIASGINVRTYTADGWMVVVQGASANVVQVPGRKLTLNALQIQGAAGCGISYIDQRIEANMAAPLNYGGTIIVQAWIKNETGGSFTPFLSVFHASVRDNFASLITDVNLISLQPCPDGAWTQVAYAFTLAAGVALNGISISITFPAVITGAGKNITVCEFDVRAAAGATPGLIASPPTPELRFLLLEGAVCQRYYRRITPLLICIVGGPATYYNNTPFRMSLDPVMRASPVFTQLTPIVTHEWGVATTVLTELDPTYITIWPTNKPSEGGTMSFPASLSAEL